MPTPLSRRILHLGGLLLALLACGDEDRETVFTAALADGTYRVAYWHGHAAEDEADLLAVTARLDRAAGRLVLAMADGTEQSLTFTPRPRDEWPGDCATMSSTTVCEVADLSPAPLHVESLAFTTPIAYAKCSPNRMILANDPMDESLFLAFDLQ